MKSFSDKEKEIIRAKLLEKGKELFGHYGVKKTSVDDITKSIPIAAGSFYAFFDSKEELFYEVLMQEYKYNKEGFVEAFSKTDKPYLSLYYLIKNSVEYLDSNPIIKRMLHLEESEMVFRKLTSEQRDNINKATIEPLKECITNWQKKGLIIPGNPEVLVSLITSIYYLTLHQQEIGKNLYPEMLEKLSRFIADGLTNVKK